MIRLFYWFESGLLEQVVKSNPADLERELPKLAAKLGCQITWEHEPTLKALGLS